MPLILDIFPVTFLRLTVNSVAYLAVGGEFRAREWRPGHS
jgi:hypothetical protein